MTIKDTTANLTSVAGMTMSALNIEMILTVAVLVSALILNVTRLYDFYKKRNDSDGQP